MSQAKAAEAHGRTAAKPRYDSLLVHVQPGLTTTHRVEVAAAVARLFDARLIGLGAAQVEPLPYADPSSGALLAEAYTQLREQVAAGLDSAEAAFRRDAAGVELEWRRVEAMPRHAIAAAARAADLIVLGGDDAAKPDGYTAADAAEAAIDSGRPVLLVPVGAPHLQAKRIVIAWKDAREARRAVADALPFLARAEDVVVMAVCGKDGTEATEAAAADVASALRRRGVPARTHVVTAPDASVAEELNAEAAAIGADLIVAGAYGHSRAAEWAFGGVTRGLMRDPTRYVLLSH